MRMYSASAVSCSKHNLLKIAASPLQFDCPVTPHTASHLTSMCAFAVAVAVSAGYSLAIAFCSTTQDSLGHAQLPGASHAEQASVAAVEHVTPSVQHCYC
jgi:Na+(H+)/acetate symporter ActP